MKGCGHRFSIRGTDFNKQKMTHEHALAIFEKPGAANRAEAVAIALRRHLLKI